MSYRRTFCSYIHTLFTLNHQKINFIHKVPHNENTQKHTHLIHTNKKNTYTTIGNAVSEHRRESGVFKKPTIRHRRERGEVEDQVVRYSKSPHC